MPLTLPRPMECESRKVPHLRGQPRCVLREVLAHQSDLFGPTVEQLAVEAEARTHTVRLFVEAEPGPHLDQMVVILWEAEGQVAGLEHVVKGLVHEGVDGLGGKAVLFRHEDAILGDDERLILLPVLLRKHIRSQKRPSASQ